MPGSKDTTSLLQNDTDLPPGYQPNWYETGRNPATSLHWVHPLEMAQYSLLIYFLLSPIHASLENIIQPVFFHFPSVFPLVFRPYIPTFDARPRQFPVSFPLFFRRLCAWLPSVLTPNHCQFKTSFYQFCRRFSAGYCPVWNHCPDSFLAVFSIFSTS